VHGPGLAGSSVRLAREASRFVRTDRLALAKIPSKGIAMSLESLNES
jgi:hypothetical protein